MIDTPGHVDFTYEVVAQPGRVRGRRPARRRRAGHRGADAGQPVPGARERPADHPGAEQDRPARRPARPATPPRSRTSSAASPTTCCGSARRPARASRNCSTWSAREVPAPVGDADAPPRAMIFDSVYDIYRGVITYIRVVDGQFTPRERIKMMSTGATHELLEIGVISPEPMPDRRAQRRRGRLPDHRREGRAAVAGRRHRHRRGQAGEAESLGALPRPAARWSTPGCIRSTAPTTRCCATRSTGCGSTTPRWSTSRRPRPRSASASAAASSACCTWRSPATGSSASSTST